MDEYNLSTSSYTSSPNTSSNSSTLLNASADYADYSYVDDDDVTQTINFLLLRVGITVVCVFGIVGNVLNLAVLLHKQMRKKMEHLERNAHAGLVALAVSDSLFCIFALPSGVLTIKIPFTADDNLLPLYYDAYIKAQFLGIFIVCSSWLTVVMALGRYLAVCWPIHARAFITTKGTVTSIIVVYIGSVVINLPLFWFYGITTFNDGTSSARYYPGTGWLLKQGGAMPLIIYVYNLVHAVVGVIIPVCILGGCNIYLIRALRQSRRMQRQHTVAVSRRKNTDNRLTATLVAIVILFLLLASPAEFYKFVHLFVDVESSQLAANVTNFLQTCNFAINFILYCALNVNFRKTVKYIVLCKRCRKTSASSRAVSNGKSTILLHEPETCHTDAHAL